MASNERQVTLRIAAEDAWSQTMNELKVALAMLPKEVLDNMQKTNAAFSQLKIKSSLDIEAEKLRLLESFKQIKQGGTASSADIQRAYSELKTGISKLNGDLQASGKKTGSGLAEATTQGLGEARKTWNQFVGERMGDYMKLEGGHAGAMKRIGAEWQKYKAGLADGAYGAKGLTDSTNQSTAAVGGLSNLLGSMAPLVVSAFSVTAIVGFIKSAFDASMQMDSLVSKFQVLGNSSGGMNEDLEFTRQLARKLGLDFQMTADSYASFMIAAKGTSAEGAPARQLFVGITEAITAMHLPVERATSILTQFQQMLAKGKVNQQDMKVAAESGIPVYRILGEAMGKNTRQIFEMMEAGTLYTSLVAGPMGKALSDQYGAAAVEAATKGRAALQNFNSTVFETKSAFGEALQPAIKLVLTGFEKLVFASKNLLSYAEIMGIGLGAAFDKAGVKAAAFFNRSLFTDEGKAKVKRSIEAIDSAAAESFKILEVKYGIYSQGVSDTNKKGVDQDKINNDRRRDEAKKTGEDLAKINLDYAKAINQAEDELTATMAKEYQERIIAVKAYYDQKKAASKSNDEEVVWEKLKTGALKTLAEQHARESEIITARMIQRGVDLRKEGLAVETSAIKQQAADQVITEEDAALKITALTVASLRDQYTARQYVAEKIAAIYGKDSDDYKKALKEQQSSHKAYIDANMSAYKTYADKIKNLDKEIADFRRSIAEKISDLKQKGMTDEQKYADNLARFNTAIDAAESARRQKKTEEALRYSKQAEELAGRLGDTQTAKINGVKAAEEALRKVEENRVKILEEQKEEAQESLDKLKALNEQKLDPKQLQINVDKASLDIAAQEIASLTKTEKKTIMIETMGPDTTRYDNSIRGMASGGRVGGSGIGDTQLRMLDPREHVIRPEATAYWGDGLLAAFNAPWTAFGQTIAARLKGSSLPYIPTAPSFAMAAGGKVGSMTDMGTLNITVGGGSFPVMGKVDVLSELKTALRRESLVRQQ